MPLDYKSFVEAPRKFSQRKRTVAAASVFALAGVAGFAIGSNGVFSTLTNTESYTQVTEAGTVRLKIGESVEGTFDSPIGNLKPGDKVYSYTEIKNDGTLKFSNVHGRINAAGELVDIPRPYLEYTQMDNQGKPVTITGNGGTPLLFTVESCTSQWINNACTATNIVEVSRQAFNSSALYTRNPNLSSGDPKVSPTGFEFKSLKNLMPNESRFFKITYELPANAGQEYYGKTAAFHYTMTAIQRPEHQTAGKDAF